MPLDPWPWNVVFSLSPMKLLASLPMDDAAERSLAGFGAGPGVATSPRSLEEIASRGSRGTARATERQRLIYVHICVSCCALRGWNTWSFTQGQHVFTTMELLRTPQDPEVLFYCSSVGIRWRKIMNKKGPWGAATHSNSADTNTYCIHLYSIFHNIPHVSWFQNRIQDSYGLYSYCKHQIVFIF